MKAKSIVIAVLRLLLAFVFIFSGFVKAVDPWGTAIQAGEYFHAFGIGWLDWSKYIVSIGQSALEMLLGFMLLFRLKEKFASLLVMILMVFFTLLTLYIAIWEPVADCGCFGDAIKLTNWQTFFKNLVLLPCSIALWLLLRGNSSPSKVHPMVEGSMIFMFALFSAGVGIYSLRHLPILDFLPYKAGTHIPTAMQATDSGDVDVTLIYKDRTTGKERQFTLDDTEWQDTLRWEFVDTRIVDNSDFEQPAITDFSIFGQGEDITRQLLASPYPQFIITLTDPAALTDRCRERLEEVVLYAREKGYYVFCVTSSSFGSDIFRITDDARIPVYSMDGVTLKTMIRATEGLVILKDGVIIGKWNCGDIPKFKPDSDRELSSFLPAGEASGRECRTVSIMLAILVAVYVVWFLYRRSLNKGK